MTINQLRCCISISASTQKPSGETEKIAGATFNLNAPANLFFSQVENWKIKGYTIFIEEGDENINFEEITRRIKNTLESANWEKNEIDKLIEFIRQNFANFETK